MKRKSLLTKGFARAAVIASGFATRIACNSVKKIIIRAGLLLLKLLHPKNARAAEIVFRCALTGQSR
jgi:hypothetical protein